MDSTNSGSNQSSSSGDNEEFDDDAVGSRADLSSFLNLLPSSHPPPPVNTSSSSSIFDSFSPYFTPFPFPPPPEAGPLSLDASAAWSSLHPPPPLSSPLQPSFLSASAPSAAAPSQPPPPPRGSKKRTRASRRAPTTVINTEASNFRAMVQQFTGFPTPPFAAAAAPFPVRPRLDLFGAAAAGVVSPFLLRPSAHNMIPSPLSSSSSSSVASLFDRTISRPSHLATTVSATPDSSNAIPPKYHDHDKFNLSLFDVDMQSGAAAAAAAFDAPPPSFLQPPRSQMAPLPQFPSDSAAMNPGWDVEEEQAVEEHDTEPAPSKILIRNFRNNQS